MRLLKGFWYGLMAVFWLAGLLTGRREFFLLLFIMGFVLLYSLGLNIWTGMSFSYTQEIDKKVCVKGGQASMRVAIYNDKPFPFPLIRLAVLPVARSRRAYADFSLLPRSHITFTVPLPCPYRGIYGVGMTTLEINDSFGLVRTTFNMLKLPYYRPAELKVYPRLTELTVLPAGRNDTVHIGNAGQWHTEQGESYAGLRPYRPGDPFKRVHRAVSARRREWYVRTYDLPLETSVVIALDTAVGNVPEEEGLYLGDLVCECAAAIAHYSLKAGHRVIYRDPGLALILKSVKDFPKLNNRLTALLFEADADFGTCLRQAAGQFPARAVYVISARGRGGEILSRLDTSRINLKFIAAGGAPGAEGGVPGVQTVSVTVGGDVAAALES